MIIGDLDDDGEPTVLSDDERARIQALIASPPPFERPPPMAAGWWGDPDDEEEPT